jgi:MFS family permease
MNTVKIAAALRIMGGNSFAPADAAEWRAGWRVVAGAAVGMATGIGLYLLVASLFITHITREFGWTRGDMGIAGMVAFLTGAIALPLIGRLLDRFGFRRIVLVCVPAVALLYVAIALQPGWYWFYLVLMVWGGMFGGGTGAISYTRPVIAAFERQRGLALGVTTAGTSITAMLIPPLLGAAIAAYGWRAGLYAMIAVTLFVGLPLALSLFGGAQEGAARAVDDIPDGAVPAGRGMTVGEAVRDTRFWLLALALVAINIPGSGIVGQLAPLVGDKGLSDSAAALVMSVYAFGLFVGRLVTGFALDRVPPNLVGAVMTLVPALGIVLLMIPSPSFALAALAVGMIGMQQGSEVDLIAYFVSRNFGVTHYGSIYGMIAMAGALSTAVALVLFGKIHDVTGTYDIALTIGAFAFGTGAAAFASIGRGRAAGRLQRV